MPIPISKLLRLAFIIALLYSIFKPIVFDSIEEFCPWGSEFGDIFYQISLSYVGGYIFYWIANYQNKKIEHEKNKTINKVKVEKLIESIQGIIFMYLVYIGEEEKIKSANDLLTISIDNSMLRIGIRDEIPRYTILSKVGEETVEKNGNYFNCLIEKSTNLRKSIELCVDGYVLMPLELIKIIEDLNQNFNIEGLLKSYKNTDEYFLEYKPEFPNRKLLMEPENQAIRKEINILRESVKKVNSYYELHFKNDHFNKFNIEFELWNPAYNLDQLKTE